LHVKWILFKKNQREIKRKHGKGYLDYSLLRIIFPALMKNKNSSIELLNKDTNKDISNASTICFHYPEPCQIL
jgi:hypothetical protein